jgi:hypothetical protein
LRRNHLAWNTKKGGTKTADEGTEKELLAIGRIPENPYTRVRSSKKRRKGQQQKELQQPPR